MEEDARGLGPEPLHRESGCVRIPAHKLRKDVSTLRAWVNHETTRTPHRRSLETSQTKQASSPPSKGEARSWPRDPNYDTLKLRLEAAHSAAEAVAIEARRRVRLNEGR